MSVTPHNDQRVAQLIDANLDRAREGLRVIEDWCRFALKRKDLVILIKNWRHDLGNNHKNIYKQARSIHSDPGAQLNHPSQNNRSSPLEVVFANCARAQEALRVIEEFSRESNHQLTIISSKIRYELYSLEKEILKASNAGKRKELLQQSKLCLITSPNPNLIQTVSDAVKAGITMVQYRPKRTNDSDKVSEAKGLADICKKHNSLFIVNDRIDVAIAVEADGVHLGQEDFPLNDARKILGAEKIIGLSTHSLEQVEKANQQDCDYIGIGPIYESKSKPNAKAIGLKTLSEAMHATHLPCFAIGGINSANISELLANGATRIAVINAIMNAKNPESISRDFVKRLK